jgi:Rieske Fe-S protein
MFGTPTTATASWSGWNREKGGLMARVFDALNRRTLLKLFLALPLIDLLESFLSRLLSSEAHAAAAGTRLAVAKLSQLDKAWSTAPFEYFVKVKGKDLKGDTVREEYLPGLVVRLPDDLARQRGGEPKGKFEVVNLYCTHQRCKTAFIGDVAEVHGMTGQKVEHPVFYCPCHRSLFDASKGAEPMAGSQAKLPLWKFNFEIKGDDLIVTGVDPKVSSWEAGNPGGLSSEYPVRPGERGL